MTTYFLSYARLDERVALRIADALIAAGVSVWVDQYDIRPSQHWDRAVETAVRGCEGMIVILSPRSADSANVADEVAVALDGRKDIIPILIAPCTPPLRMTRMQFIDATKDLDDAIRRCLTTIRGKARDTQPPSPEAAPAASGLSGDVLQDAERRLTGIMGPIAGVLVRQAAAKAASREDLYEALAKSIANPIDRKSFLDWTTDLRPAGQVVTPRTTRIPEGPAVPGRISPEEIEEITGALKPYVGPIAAQLVARERQAATSKEDLCQRVSLRIAGEKERAAFLRKTHAE
ncbi:MAG TPA: toll/interleukin-1 receptor domain-containing protein [Phenylobacterium sp.]